MTEKLEQYKAYLLARNQSLVYYNYTKQWLEFIESKNYDLMNITQTMITEFFTANEYMPNSKNNFIKSGRNFYKFLEIPDDKNEWNKIKYLKTETQIPQYLSETDLDKAIKYLATYHTQRLPTNKIGILLKFMFYTGLRKGELLELKRENIDVENCSLKVHTIKSKSEDIVYFPEKIKQELSNYFNSEKEEINAFNVTLAQINYIPRLIAKHLNKKIKVHTFRHSCGRFLAQEKNISLPIIQKLLRHQNIKTTMLYIQPDEEEIRRFYKSRVK
jgi:integrase/recombinase XerD